MDFYKTNQRPLLYLDAKKHPEMAFRVEDATKNVFLLGNTGTGKSSVMAILMAAILDKRGLSEAEKMGIFATCYKHADIDTYREICYRCDRMDDLVIISPESGYVINPMDYYAEDDPINIVQLLSTLAELNLKNGQRQQDQAFWTQSLEKRLGMLIAIGRMSGEELSIANLARLDESQPENEGQLYDNPDFAQKSYYMKMMDKALKNVGADDEEFQILDQYTRQMATLSSNTSSSIRAMSSALLSIFQTNRVLRKLFSGKSNLDLEELCRGKVVILDLSIQRLKKVGQLAQGILLYLFRDFLERRDVRKCPNVMIFNIDEFWAFQDNYWHHFLSICRSARSGAILASQSHMGLVAALGGGLEAQAKVDTLLNLASMKFLLAQNEPKSCEYYSQLIGKEFRDIGSATVGQDFGTASATINRQLHYRVMPHHFASELRTGGSINNFYVDAFCVATGRKFTNGSHATKVSFKQWFAT